MLPATQGAIPSVLDYHFLTFNDLPYPILPSGSATDYSLVPVAAPRDSLHRVEEEGDMVTKAGIELTTFGV